MKIICVGRNYKNHVRELNNTLPEHPVIFMKPATAILRENKPFYIPEFTEEVHHEVEWIVKICKNGKYIDKKFASRYYEEMSVGIDFTARDIQQKLKNQGLPWEISKGFDFSAAIGRWISVSEDEKGNSVDISLKKNGVTVQVGQSEDMIFSIEELISYISKFFKLQFGDIIFTGTPAGVGKISVGDNLEGYLNSEKLLTCDIK